MYKIVLPPYCPACGELSDMKVSTDTFSNVSTMPLAIRPPWEYPAIIMKT